MELGRDSGLSSPGTGREDFLITLTGAWFLFLVQLANVVMFEMGPVSASAGPGFSLLWDRGGSKGSLKFGLPKLVNATFP